MVKMISIKTWLFILGRKTQQMKDVQIIFLNFRLFGIKNWYEIKRSTHTYKHVYKVQLFAQTIVIWGGGEVGVGGGVGCVNDIGDQIACN